MLCPKPCLMFIWVQIWCLFWFPPILQHCSTGPTSAVNVLFFTFKSIFNLLVDVLRICWRILRLSTFFIIPCVFAHQQLQSTMWPTTVFLEGSIQFLDFKKITIPANNLNICAVIWSDYKICIYLKVATLEIPDFKLAILFHRSAHSSFKFATGKKWSGMVNPMGDIK